MICYFNSPGEGIKIAYQIYKAQNELAAALFLTGRAEYFLKYEHFFNDLNSAGITVFAMDHRGQGASERMLEDQQKGHVENFNFFVDDATYFLKKFVVPQINGKIPLFLISHSMGGAVSFLLENKLKLFCKTVFCSPMWGINFGHMPENIIYFLAKLFCTLGKDKEFVPGKKEYDPDSPFENNDITHSLENFEKQKLFLKHNPDFALGGPTNRWVLESIRAMKEIEIGSPAFSTQTLLLQAGADTVVDNTRQDRVLKNMKNSRKIVIENALHEILNEEKVYYDQAVKHILGFLLK
ncbi:MAG TPA: alpha/beta fold hydrolase [bacterium]|nr:alpha/beta fold hydrolase [bacterium]